MTNTQVKADFIKIPPAPDGTPQTHPVEPSSRLPQSEITVSLCTPDDLPDMVEGFHTAFSPTWFNMMEPLDRRAPDAVRHQRLMQRLRPTFRIPQMKWVKATLAPENKTIGVAGWMAPGHPPCNIWRRDGVEYYNWKESEGWSDEDVEEIWSGIDMEAWKTQVNTNDKARFDFFAGEEHWYLAPLYVWPEYQGRGVGKLLLDWAIEQADASKPPTPLYLESAPHARAIYMHSGFYPIGEANFVRRGPRVVRGLEAEEGKAEETQKTGTTCTETQVGDSIAA